MERTGLHIASSKGHLLICKLLLQKGAYVNHLDKLDRTALYYAIENGNYQIANVKLN